MPMSWPLRRPVVALACLVALAHAPAALADASATGSRTPVATVVEKVWSGAQDLAVYALGLIGVEYRWGGDEPASGVDCSGLVKHVFQQVTGVTLPRTAKEMSRLGDRIGRHDLVPGDLVFFNTRRFAFSHVGIYLGDGRFIHAPRRGREVEVADLGNRYWQARFDGARRLVGVLPSLVPSLVASAEAAPLVRPEPDAEPSADATPGP